MSYPRPGPLTILTLSLIWKTPHAFRFYLPMACTLARAFNKSVDPIMAEPAAELGLARAVPRMAGNRQAMASAGSPGPPVHGNF